MAFALQLSCITQYQAVPRRGRYRLHSGSVMAQSAASVGGGTAAAAAAAPAVDAPMHAAPTQQPATSQRVQQTDAPCIVATKKLVASTEGTLSLAQGACPPLLKPQTHLAVVETLVFSLLNC
jgi:hypothetical protein